MWVQMAPLRVERGRHARRMVTRLGSPRVLDLELPIAKSEGSPMRSPSLPRNCGRSVSARDVCELWHRGRATFGPETPPFCLPSRCTVAPLPGQRCVAVSGTVPR